eukprot:CAMPEP_0177787210 /NCGR_PEP_ID=MMETSP0491_2-20121128/21350_1 /TAXON_ID=63592 /ORGANISM="Tetraselmis chuii, Strain PLY429" /LENGTH=57 /DNA_ID=CAMNT_0019308503 /DNA_START=92 /DNA_END=265 /DNA_ORIENTATION=+
MADDAPAPAAAEAPKVRPTGGDAQRVAAPSLCRHPAPSQHKRRAAEIQLRSQTVNTM